VQLQFTFHSPAFDALVRACALQKLMYARSTGLHAAIFHLFRLFCAMLLSHLLALRHYLSKHPFAFTLPSHRCSGRGALV
jgi:hypothetical protein